jgi:serine/threonine protein kinase
MDLGMTDGPSKTRLEERLKRSGRDSYLSSPRADALRELSSDAVELPLELGRYTLHRYLGGGAVGRVYEAHDEVKNQRVALKIFRQSGPEVELLLKREFRSLIDLSHPNLVTFLEACVEPELCYFTMELVDGVDFRRYVVSDTPFASAEQSVPCDLLRLRAVLRQLASAVAALHGRGVVHRDLKPNNVLVTASGRLVVLDFGISHIPQYASVYSTFSGRAVGTPAYMSPEQLLRQAATPASDCYAIGVMLYQALVGDLPLSGPTYEAIYQARVRGSASRPSEYVDNLPADLDALCYDLLNPAPELRPTCADILARLGIDSDAPPPAAPADTEAIEQAPFVGRARELNALRDALDASITSCIVLAVGGPAGIGKSTLVKRFLDELDPAKHVVLSAKCYERESVPYKTIDALLDALVAFLKPLATRDIQRLRPRHLPDLVRTFPSLTRVEAFADAAKEPSSADDHERKQRAIAALRDLFGRIADRARLVLWVDDMQWGDRDSVVVIRQLLSSPQAPACLCIGSLRVDTMHLHRLARRFLRDSSASSPILVRTLKVGRLPTADSQALARALMSDKSDAAIDHVARESEGSPFLLWQLAEHSIEPERRSRLSTFPALRRAKLSADAGGAAQDRDGSATLGHVVAARLSRMSPAAIEALRLVAIAGGPVEQRVIASAAQLNDDTVFHALRTARLVNTDGSGDRARVELYHRRLAQPILAPADAERVRGLHRQLADAMIVRGSRDHERIAFHLQKAGDEAKAVDYLLTGADDAYAALAHARAVQLYTFALKMGIDDVRAQSIRRARADSLRNTGRGLEAARAYLEAATLESDEWRHFELRRRAAQEYLFSGHLDEGRELLDGLLPHVQLSLPKSRARAIAELLARRGLLAARGMRFKSRAEADIPRSELARVDTCWLLEQAVIMFDPLVGNMLQGRHVMLALDCGEPTRVVRAVALDAALASYGGPPARARAERLLDLARAVNSTIDDAFSRANVSLWTAACAYFMGEPGRALREAEVAERILREDCVGTAYELATCHLVVLGSHYMRGTWLEFIRRADAALREALERGNRYQSVGLRTHTQMARLVEDDSDGARREIQCVRDEWPQDGFHMQHLAIFLGEARVHLYCDDGEAAVKHIEAMWPDLKKSMLLFARFVRVESVWLRARSYALAYAQTQNPRYKSGALRDIAELESLEFLAASGHAHFVRASIAAADGEKQRAVEILRRAASSYEQDHIPFFAAIARYRIGQLTDDPLEVERASLARRLMRASGIKNLDAFVRLMSGAQHLPAPERG